MKSNQIQLFDEKENQIKFNGLDATFNPSHNKPLFSWYPYLEGYSPDFVKDVYSQFMPKANLIIDPFAGSGTTPIVLESMGNNCGYCEINPVMNVISSTKIEVSRLTKNKRKAIRSEINELVQIILKDLNSFNIDGELLKSYTDSFGDSIYFEENNFNEVLKIRNLLDSVDTFNPTTLNLLEISILSNLVTCSLLKRAGDVRFKTKKELEKGIPNFRKSVVDHLNKISHDLLFLEKGSGNSFLISENSLDLMVNPEINADGVITSPPYLNGTNYIRNTKLELWFLRKIQNGLDLRNFRDKVVTSGINDVLKDTGRNSVCESVDKLVDDLNKHNYDSRIPRMVSGYFEDMKTVISGLSRNTTKNAIICIDIGDSKYSGIHIPTHKLLTDISKEVGLESTDEILLRSRTSKDQSKLGQYLLVFKKNKSHKKKNNQNNFLERWDWFKNSLPHQKAPYNARNWGNDLHSICSYQGKMKPALAYFLVHTFSNPGDKVLDPFSGAGTIPFEAALSGRNAVGIDISTLGYSISKAKVTKPDLSKLESLIKQLEKKVSTSKPNQRSIEIAKEVNFNKSIKEYFHPKTFDEIVISRDFLLNNKDDSAEWSWIMSCILHILHGNRPYALSRRSHPITPFAPTGPFEYKPVIEHLKNKLNRSLEIDLPDSFKTGTVIQADILSTWHININKVDAIITSPPFLNSTRFYMTNWMRFWFCGWSKSDFSNETKDYIETKQSKSMSVYKDIFANCYECLKKDALVVFHLGKSKKNDMARELCSYSDTLFDIVDLFDESVEHCEKHGVKDKGTVTGHQYLILRKK